MAVNTNTGNYTNRRILIQSNSASNSTNPPHPPTASAHSRVPTLIIIHNEVFKNHNILAIARVLFHNHSIQSTTPPLTPSTTTSPLQIKSEQLIVLVHSTTHCHHNGAVDWGPKMTKMVIQPQPHDPKFIIFSPPLFQSSAKSRVIIQSVLGAELG